MDSNKAAASERELRGNRIEWTGAGGDYFLAVVVDQEDDVIAERWGTRKEVLAWMETHWPQLPTKFVPMVYSPAQRHLKSSDAFHGNGCGRSTAQRPCKKEGNPLIKLEDR